MRTEQEFADFAYSVTPMLHRTAWLLTSDRHAAEDLVQETLAKLYVARRRPIDNPAGYARTVLVRLHVDTRRRRSSTEVVTDHVPERAVEDDQTSRLALRAAMASLGPSDRAVLVLRYFFELSVAETARDLKLTEGAVRMRSQRALARLREQLGELSVPDDDPSAARQP